MIKKIGFGLLAIIVIAVLAILYYFKADGNNSYGKEEVVDYARYSGSAEEIGLLDKDFGKDFHKCDYTVPGHEIPTFKDAKLASTNVFDNKKSLPLMGSAMIDVDNDGVDEIFVAGGVTQEDAIFKYVDGGFEDVSAKVSLPNKPTETSTFGAVSFDLDNDGNTDLLLTGDYGLLWYRNTGAAFEAQKIEVPLNEKTAAASITIGDINRDGHADIFVSGYIKLNKMEGQTIFKDFNYGGSSLMMVNNGDNTFTDATKKLGLTYVHNTFMGVLVDIDNDGYLDLVVAHDTGEVRTYKNNEGTSFTMKENPLTGKYAYPMGIAVGDYNNDGNIDFFFSNTGTSVPHFLGRGDLAEEDEYISDWILFRNDGDFKFTDTAKETKVADFEFSWGAIFQDFNLDGLQDLVVAENYVDFPPHKLFKLPGRFLIQRADGTFAAVEDQANAINKNYAITPLTSDFNQDGYPDLAFANLNGPFRALMNEGGKASYIGIRLAENAKNAGASIIVTKMDDTRLCDAYVIGEGLASDQTSTVTFGLAGETAVKSVRIRYADGTSQVIENPEINKTHRLK